MGILDIPICILVLIFGIKFKNKFKYLNSYDRKILDYLFYFHVFMGVVFYFYVIGRGDAVHYWMHPKDLNFQDLVYNISTRRYASDYIFFLNFFFSNTLDLTFFTGSMMYTVLGYVAIVYFYVILKNIIPNYQNLRTIKIFGIPIFPFFLFFPNLHFWSSGVGKDTLLFFCAALFIYSLLNIKKNIFNILLSIILSVFVRPHITLFLIAGFGIGYTLSGKLKMYQKVFIVSIFIVLFALMFNYVLQFIRLESVDMASIQEYGLNRSRSLVSRSGSGVDTSGYPYPLKIFTYLYRPLFFDINNAIAVVASFENLFLLLLTFKCFKTKSLKLLLKSNHIIKGGIFFLLLGTLTFSLILGNLGIMLRQKNMFAPMFLIVAFWLLLAAKNSRKRKIIRQV